MFRKLLLSLIAIHVLVSLSFSQIDSLKRNKLNETLLDSLIIKAKELISKSLANGYLGNFIIIIPSKNLVVVRTMTQERWKSDKDDFGSIYSWASKIVE